jgi:adenylate cyclase
MERRLTAILCADVHGYSRLMGENEEATVRTLSAHRRIIDSRIEQHHGRFVNSAGDSVLAEFPSVVNAVECAVEIQTKLRAENASLPAERRMEFRIGVNLGDVVVDGEQIYGDGINVAARLESLADPGGIYISGKVQEEIQNKLSLNCIDLGEQRVKNIAKTVHVFRVLPGESGPATRSSPRVARRYVRRGALSIAGLAVIGVIIVLIQHVSLRPPQISASIPPTQSAALPLPDIPSIAVLPFANLSGDHEQEYFSDGITDDLVSALSRVPGLFVIASASTLTYKDKAPKLQDVGRELGVKYILEGSVRKAGEKVRITVQLVDATTGADLWAERYDRPLRDVFALQDEIVRKIATTLNLQIELMQRGVLLTRTTENLEAYDDLLRGAEYFLFLTKEGNAKARAMFEKAIELDPKYAAAYAWLAWNNWLGWIRGINLDPHALDSAFQLAHKSIALDDAQAGPHSILAAIYVYKGECDRAVAEAKRGIALDQNFALGYMMLAEVMNYIGEPAQALAAVQKAIRLDPRNIAYYEFEKGLAHTVLGEYEESIPPLLDSLSRDPNIWAHVFLVDDYLELGRENAAQVEAAEVERMAALDANSATGYLALAHIKNTMAQPAQALVALEQARRLDPENPDRYIIEQGKAYTQLGQYEEAIHAFKRSITLYPNHIVSHVWLAQDYIELGRENDAHEEAAEVLRNNPQFSSEKEFPTVGPKGGVLAENLRFNADLRKAGLK